MYSLSFYRWIHSERMASSLESALGVSSGLNDQERFFYSCRLLLDGGTELLRQEFDKIFPPTDLHNVLCKEKLNLQKLPRSVLSTSMLQKLYPTSATCGKPTDFDITLLMVLFRYLCRLEAPPSSNNWSNMPVDSDKSLAADILRLKIYRNTVFAHAEACCISKDDFEQISNNICVIFERRGGTFWKLKAETMLKEPLTQCESAYMNQLKEWQNHDTDVKEICQELASNVKKQGEKIELIKEQLDQILKQNQEVRETNAEVSSKLTSDAAEQQLEAEEAIDGISTRIALGMRKFLPI